MLARCSRCQAYVNPTWATCPVCAQTLGQPSLPPPYPGHPVGAPFRPGNRVWLYRFDDQTPRFAAPVMIVHMRTLWAGEQDIGWRTAAGELTWHNARLAVAVATQEGSLYHTQEEKRMIELD